MMNANHFPTWLLSSCSLFLVLQAPPSYSNEAVQLSLNQALEMALANNLNLLLKKQDMEMAQGITETEHGRFDSMLQAGAATGESRLTPTMEGTATIEDNSSWSASLGKRLVTGTELGLSWTNVYSDSNSDYSLINPLYTSGIDLEINQPLLQGLGRGVQTAEIRTAEKKAEAVTFLVHREAAELAAQVRKTYWQLVSAWQDIEVFELSLSLARQLEEQTRSKIEAGMLAGVEIFQPQAEVAKREQNLIAGERAMGVAEDSLRLLLNNQEWNRALTPIDRPKIEAALPQLDIVLKNALANRPDIRAADRQTEAAEITSLSLRNKTLPALDLFGSVGLAGNDEDYSNALERLSRDSDTRWQAGVRFSVPLENRSAEGRYRQGKIALKQARTQAELMRQQTRSLARQAVRDVQLNLKAIEATSKTSLASQKRLEAEQEKFGVGKATTFDVLVAQEAYSQALADEYRARILLAQSLAELDRIQGIVRIE